MERPDDAPLADEGQRGATPDDQPLGGPAGPGDENMPPRPVTSGPGGDGPREPSPAKDRDQA
ncbi:MAG TPA: hypothetical protein VGV90_14245 [Solirubrobacteraceae bacterium]|nr:hypothetical protein [Solirubrobacteraceae bacterium]